LCKGSNQRRTTTAVGFEVTPTTSRCPSPWYLAAMFCALLALAHAQTATTGSLIGFVVDPSDSAVPGVILHLVEQASGESHSAVSDKDGRFSFSFLRPGSYQLQISKSQFAPLTISEIVISVTETRRVEVHLRLATVVEQTQVSSELPIVQTDNSTLGRTVGKRELTSLPLVTRNVAQIVGLSPGVSAGVFNAGELGLGGIALSQIARSNDGIFVHGARSYDNNWELDGISVSDVQGSGAGSGGIPIPNPDGLQEFKVQTALYDAAYGRYGGANVSVITKSGTNFYHGTVFEFLRNDVLNANDFFLNKVGRPRPSLKQNQFGFSFGGPIKKEKLLFFGSYQETRQVNGVAAGQSRIACTSSLSSPPLTNDRSQIELGRLFGGMSGTMGGVAIEPDGSNINPAALALLNFRLPDGSFLIPTPQTIDSSRPYASEGFSVFTYPCDFEEDQFLANADYFVSQKSKLAARFFFANANKTVTFPGNFFNPAPNIPGFSSPNYSGNRVFSLAHTYTFDNALLNQLRLGFVRTTGRAQSHSPFAWSNVGVTEGEMSMNDELPNLNILGSVAFSSAFPLAFAQNSFIFSDGLSFVHGAHTLRFGGSVTRVQDNFRDPGLGSFVQFLSWPDFLLGLSAKDNGTGTFSNVFASIDDFGLFDRDFRVWEASLFSQDDYRIGKRLTLNFGLRYEWLGQFGDRLGRNSSFDVSQANPNPPPNGSVAGYVVASNFHGIPPPGVLRSDNTFANEGDGQNTIAPRLGFAWQVLPTTSQFLLRGGYGIYFSRPTGQAFYQSASAAPFALLRVATGATNSDASFQSPFSQPFPTEDSFPLFPPYSPTTAVTIYTSPPNFRSALIQQYSLNVQEELAKRMLLEVGYVGTRGTHLQRVRSLNQALSASPTNPIREVMSNTLANVPARVPIPGIPADSLDMVESEGSSWYNGLEASLTKRLGHGLQFLASYTFSKALDTDGADINGTGAGIVLTQGDQNSPRQRWGRASFDRTQRFIFSTTWSIPSPRGGLTRSIAGDWTFDAMATIQSGSALTITDTNSTNVFGISEDRAQLSGNCSKNHLVRRGSVEAKLNGYFNALCFTTPPVIGADGIGTAFGNSATGIVDGPGQANLDIALSKTVALNWPVEKSSLQFRAEFFNALNHPQFSNPDTNFSSPTFGLITSTSVNPRVAQLAMKFIF
jgi:Carboxypeptidase regulatory-like domain/TonB dependent receptor